MPPQFVVLKYLSKTLRWFNEYLPCEQWFLQAGRCVASGLEKLFICLFTFLCVEAVIKFYYLLTYLFIFWLCAVLMLLICRQ